MTYGHLEREYSEDNDCTLAQAYSDLHCDCEEIDYKYYIDENGERTLEFKTMQDCNRFFERRKRKCQ